LNDACEDTWLVNVGTASCYKLMTTAVEFTDATCPDGSIFTPIESEQENAFITANITSSLTEGTWVGIQTYAEGNVTFTATGYYLTDEDYTGWPASHRFPQYPVGSDPATTTSCVAVSHVGNWKNLRCTKDLPFICRKPWNPIFNE